MNRKIAELIARMLSGTTCWTAVSTGPSHASPSAVGTSINSRVIHSVVDGTRAR